MIAYERKCHIYNQYVISVPENRDELRQFLADNDVSTEIYYPVSFHMQTCFKDLGYNEGDFPNSEYAAKPHPRTARLPRVDPGNAGLRGGKNK